MALEALISAVSFFLPPLLTTLLGLYILYTFDKRKDNPLGLTGSSSVNGSVNVQDEVEEGAFLPVHLSGAKMVLLDTATP